LCKIFRVSVSKTNAQLRIDFIIKIKDFRRLKRFDWIKKLEQHVIIDFVNHSEKWIDSLSEDVWNYNIFTPSPDINTPEMCNTR